MISGRYSRIWIFGVLALLLCTAPGSAKRKHNERIAELPEIYQTWLEEVRILISEEELEAFLALEKDYQRDSFIENFWRKRDPFPQTGRNEFRERWELRIEEVRRRFARIEEDRSVILLLNGFPDAQVPIDCTDLWPAEVWYYERAENLGHEVLLLFFQRGSLGAYRLWQPTDGVQDLFRGGSPSSRGSLGIASGCDMQEASALRSAIGYAQSQGLLGFNSVLAGLTKTPDGPSGEWVATFNSYTTDVPDGAATFEAELSFTFPGRYKTRTVVQGLVSVDLESLLTANLGGHESYNLQLVGEVLLGDRLFDSFRYSFNHPVDSAAEDRLPLIFERYLRSGDYKLILKLEDINGKKFYRSVSVLSVPKIDTTYRRPPSDPETARLLEEANAAIASGETSLKIVPPTGELHTGKLRVDTLVTGSEIDEVIFAVDDKQVLKKRDPPWSVEVDLGELPRMRVLKAFALGEGGNELARDEMTLNSGSHRFAVRLIEPRRGKKYLDSLRAEAQVEVPEDRAVERVEFYLNETLVTTVYQEPFIHPILLPDSTQIAYVRAVAYQPDGNSTEDLVFVNAPEYLEEVDVQFVELYITALDENQRPVEDLSREDFRVREDGAPQELLRYDLVRNLPIHAGILLDVSASMIDRVEASQLAALQFFEQAITPRDRATLITFNDHPRLVAKFTSDIGDLAGGLAGLKAERGTALYDSVIFALYYFNGIKGQRALVVLSDGQDEHSRFTFEDTLEYARRAGVAIYAVGLDLSRKQRDAKKKLRELTEATGGRLFLIEDINELDGVYQDIQRELRSRYYLAYQSSNTEESEDFRFIDVGVERPGVSAKTLRGYYP